MKLNKPLMTICLIIILVVNLIFFSFLSIGRKTNDREYINNLINSFKFREYLINNELINKSIKEYKYPIEVFDYLDNNKIKVFKEHIVNNLFEEKDKVADKNEIIDILNNSINRYEKEYTVDIYSYVEKDIYEFSNNIEERVNESLRKDYYNIRDFSCGNIYSLSILITISILTLIVIFERREGILINSIILFAYSFFVFYINKYFLSFGFKNILKYFENINLELDYIYISSFIVSLILFIIYIIFMIKKVARNIRINSYNRR